MFWHNKNNEGETRNFDINMVLQGTDCEGWIGPNSPWMESIDNYSHTWNIAL
jgi:hypothetical protein